MSTQDGGPAFPVIGAPGAAEDYPGMSLRDYFIAHAPSEPHEWFAVTMSSPCPPQRWMNEEQTCEYANWRTAERECGDSFIDVNAEARSTWLAEREKQRYVRWPSAWADAMLKARQP